MADTYRFCPSCGGAARARGCSRPASRSGSCARNAASGPLPRSEGRRRHDHPRPTTRGRIVLVRRAIEPGYGLWVFPGGYVDRGEEVTAAALREAREEAGLDVRLDGLVNIYSYPERPLIIIVYARTWIGGELCTDEECLEARLFPPEEIPWDELAFRSTHEALRDYLDGRVQPHPLDCRFRPPRRNVNQRAGRARAAMCRLKPLQLPVVYFWLPAKPCPGESSVPRMSYNGTLQMKNRTLSGRVVDSRCCGSRRVHQLRARELDRSRRRRPRATARCWEPGPRRRIIPSPSTCTDFKWTVTEQTATSARGSFSATCAGDLKLTGTAEGTLQQPDDHRVESAGQRDRPRTCTSCAIALTGPRNGRDRLDQHPVLRHTCLGKVSGVESIRRSGV